METSLSEQISALAGQIDNPGDDAEEQEQLLDGEGEIQEIAEEGSQEEHDIRSIADLAEANEWDVEDLYALEIAMPDQDDPIPIGKVKDEITQMRRDREELVKNLEQHAQQLQQVQAQAVQSQQADQHVAQMAGQISVLQGFLESPELQKLKEADPGGAALKVQEVNQMINGLSQQVQGYQQNLYQQQEMQRQQQLMGGEQYLRQQIPEWSDPQVEKTEKQAVAQAFLKAGYSQQDVSQMSDPRAVMLVRELVRLRQQVGAGKQAAKQVRQSAKRSLRGGRLSKGAGKQAAVQRAKKTGSKADITAAARAILTGG